MVDDDRSRLLAGRARGRSPVVKPFSPAELVARVDAILRRLAPDPGPPAPLRFGELEIDPGGRLVRLGSRQIELTLREFELLLFMARHPGQAFTRDQLMYNVWQYTFYTDTSTVTVHIRRLRAKLERNPARPHVVVGALPQADYAIGLLPPRGEKDERLTERVAAAQAAHLEAVGVREHQVEHDHIRPLAECPLERIMPGERNLGLVAGPAQVAGDDVADGRLVVDDQHAPVGLDRVSAHGHKVGPILPDRVRRPAVFIAP